MNQQFPITRKQAAPVLAVTFPGYKGRKIRVEFAEKVSFYDLN